MNIAVLHELLNESSHPIVVLIDSFDLASTKLLFDLHWIKNFFVNKVKLVVTITSETLNSVNEIDILNKFHEIGSCKDLSLTCSDELWNDIIVYGSGEMYVSKTILKLPGKWTEVKHKSPVKAKV